jgi:hypothetical protein
VTRAYLRDPCYPPVTAAVERGWDALAHRLRSNNSVISIDGPVIAPWDQLVSFLGRALAQEGRVADFVNTAAWVLPWHRVQELTSSAELRDDPDFDSLASGQLSDLLRPQRHFRVPPGQLLVVYGPGAALAPHDLLWYADLPKRYAEAAIKTGEGRNLGQGKGDGPGTTKRLFFIDWPLLDRHRDKIVPGIDCWLDMQEPESPALLDGAALRGSVARLAARPFRTRPTFNTAPWGGHWAQTQLGHSPGGRNSALGYELIGPEAGILIGRRGGPHVELPFQLVASAHPVELMGAPVHATFGTSFPVRFDYLDTAGGGNLSVHCHPRLDYMRTVFGWPYTQHESYYVMVGGEDRSVFLGLRQDADIEEFHRSAERADKDSVPLEISKFVATFPAAPHQLFLIPAGTPHGSGKGNVVLEISATPYLYSLRFYDWLRKVDGVPRAVHVEHAFRNLDDTRRADAVSLRLVQQPRTLRKGDGWQEELLGALPEMFFEVRRIVLEPRALATDRTVDSFHLLNVVEGEGVLLEGGAGQIHSLVYAETLVVPAAIGPYTLRALGPGRVRVVKALVH